MFSSFWFNNAFELRECAFTGVLEVHGNTGTVFEGLQKDTKLRSWAQSYIESVARRHDTIATRLLTTTLDIQEKLVTSKLRSTLAIAADSAISEARARKNRKNRRALNAWTPNCPPWRNRRAHCLESYYTGGPKNHVLHSVKTCIRSVSFTSKPRRRSLVREMKNWRLMIKVARK